MKPTEQPIRQAFNGDSMLRPVRCPPGRAARGRWSVLAISLLSVFFILAFSSSSALAAEVHVLTGSFGAGELSLGERSSLAVDQSNQDVYVADTGHGRVAEFEPNGTFVRGFGTFGTPTFIAIDNTAGPSSGDVYVADAANSTLSKFTAAGTLITSWGTNGHIGGFGQGIAGITVDTGGSLFVLEDNASSTVYEYNQSGTELSNFSSPHGSKAAGLTIDAEGNLYKIDGSSSNLTKFNATDGDLGEPTPSLPGLAALAIDPSNEDLYVAQSSEGGVLRRFAVNCGQACPTLEEFGVGEVSDPQGIAIEAGTHRAYVLEAGSSEVGVFTIQDVPAPSLTIGSPTAVTYTGAHVSGTVDPEGHLATCRFEYVTAQQFSAGGFAGAGEAGCAPSPGSGSSPVAVEADLQGLIASTTYHVRLAAHNVAGQSFSAEPNPTLETEAVSVPTVQIEAPTDVTATTARFSGEINPNAPGPAPQNPAFDVAWSFQCTPACSSLGGVIEADDTAHPVAAEATGLLPGVRYEVTLVGKNAGPQGPASSPQVFETPPVAPAVGSAFVSAAGASEATLDAHVDPGGAATTVRFEYLTEQQFEENGGTFAAAQSTPESASIGADDSDHLASAVLTGLAAETAYRFRAVATNAVESAAGPAAAFSTSPSAPASSGCENEALRGQNASLSLPDCRAYEQVSPSDNATVYGQSNFLQSIPTPPGLINTVHPMAAASSGGTFTYAGESPSSGQGPGTGSAGPGLGDQFFASRTSAGWNATDISPLASSPGTYYEAFSSELSSGVFATERGEPAYAPGVETRCRLLYQRQSASEEFSPVFSSEGAACHHPFFVGASADGSHQLFESAAAKAEGAQKAPGEGHENIYDSFEGALHLVNVLPKGKADPDATVGSLSSEPAVDTGGGNTLPPLDTENVVSTDGSRVFWTNLATGIVYVRENDTQEQSAESAGRCIESGLACTVQLSPGAATYESATPDGRFAYFSEAGRLWRFDLDAFNEAIAGGDGLTEADALARTALTVAGAEVQGVIGVNRTGPAGSYLYFVADAVLSANRVENGAGEEGAQPGRPNLYLAHEGAIVFVAGLRPIDDELGGDGGGSASVAGDWRAVIGNRTAQLGPDGEDLVFISTGQLTRYDNSNLTGNCKTTFATPPGCAEIYLYDAASAHISCASCEPTGVAPTRSAESGPGTFLPPDFYSITQAHRFISTDGHRVVFQTNESLVSADTDGNPDVYEWERPGTGSCGHGSAFNGGCVYLLSSGKPGSFAVLADVSADGNDVFFLTRARLTPSDGDEKVDLYDARVDGGFPVPAGPPDCSGTGTCRSAAVAPPAVQSPGSESLQATPQMHCGKGFVRKGDRCVKKPSHKSKRKKAKHHHSRRADHHRRAAR